MTPDMSPDAVPGPRGAGALDDRLRLASTAGKWVLLGTVLGSGIASLDATVVNIALPRLGEDLGTDFAGLQWVINGYTLTLASLILIGGSFGDRFGRRKVFSVGVVVFALSSLLCGLAPNITTLVAARMAQGVGGALLAPGSLAILQASFHPDDRAKAIGAWSGFGGITTAIGPFLGGWFVDAVSWRLVFLINLPLAALVLWISHRHIPESRSPPTGAGIDVLGALLGALGLAGSTYGLIERSWTIGLIGVGALVAFVIAEWRQRSPMLPLGVFRSAQFSAANVVTLFIYAGLALALFLIGLVLQNALGYSPLEAGVATLPITAIMLVFSARAGQLAQRIGPRIPMTVGPLVIAAGLLLMVRIEPGATYSGGVLPAVLVFGAGLAMTVAPLTATVLAAADAEHSGVASGVNNAVARVGGLLAVSAVPLVAGFSADVSVAAGELVAGFHTCLVAAASLVALGGLIAWAFIRSSTASVDSEPLSDPVYHCAVNAPAQITGTGQAAATQ